MTTVYILEHVPNEVVFTTDKSKCVGRQHLYYPQRERQCVSDFFQWAYMDAFLNKSDGKFLVFMDEECKEIWNSRPEGFENRPSPNYDEFQDEY